MEEFYFYCRVKSESLLCPRSAAGRPGCAARASAAGGARQPPRAPPPGPGSAFPEPTAGTASPRLRAAASAPSRPPALPGPAGLGWAEQGRSGPSSEGCESHRRPRRAGAARGAAAAPTPRPTLVPRGLHGGPAPVPVPVAAAPARLGSARRPPPPGWQRRHRPCPRGGARPSLSGAARPGERAPPAPPRPAQVSAARPARGSRPEPAPWSDPHRRYPGSRAAPGSAVLLHLGCTSACAG